MDESSSDMTLDEDSLLEKELGEIALPYDASDSKDVSRSNSVLSDGEFNERFLNAMKVLEDDDVLAPTLEESDAHIAWELEQAGAEIVAPASDPVEVALKLAGSEGER